MPPAAKKAKPGRIRAIIYCRISHDTNDATNDRALKGVDRQERDCRRYAERQGWQVVGVEIDNDISASAVSRKRQEGLARALQALQAGQADALVANSLDRITRRPDDLKHLLELADAGREIATLTGNLNLTSVEGRMQARITLAAAEAEAGWIQRRQLAKLAHDRMQGRQHLPVRTFGYSKADWRRRDPVEGKIVAGMVRDAIAGKSCTEIAKDLNARKIRTVAGTKFQSAGVKKIITNPRIAGLQAYKGKVVEIEGKVEWDALVTEAQWRKACTMIAKRSTGRRGGERKAAISGLVYCERCAKPGLPNIGKMYRTGRVYRCMMRDTGGCARAVSQAGLDRHVEALVVEALGQDRTITTIKRRKGKKAANLDQLRAMQDELARQMSAGLVSLPAFAEAGRQLKRQIIEAEKAEQTPTSPAALEAITSGTLAQRWPKLPMRTRQDIVSLVIERITIGHSSGGRLKGGHYFDTGRIEIEWKV